MPGKSHSPEGHSDRAESWFRGRQALVDGYAPKSSDDPAIALQNPYSRRPTNAKTKERLTGSLKVAEYEHQCKVIDEAQKISVVREMMPKDIKREFLTGPRKFDEIMEKLEIIINKMMADEGPVPMDLVIVSGHDTKSTHGDSDTSNDMSYEDVCAIAWKGYRASKGVGKRRDRMDQDHGIVEKELTNGRVAREKSNGKSEIRYCYDCGEQGHIGVNCPYKWANSIDEDDQTSSWESEPEPGDA